MDRDEARARFAAARVARLATVGADGRPHLVPVTFAVHGNAVVTAVDHKPKRGNDLRRLRNIRQNPGVSLLVDHYDEDWSRLWWVRADGLARVLPAAEQTNPLGRLVAKYEQYTENVPAGPVIWIEVSAWRGWAADR